MQQGRQTTKEQIEQMRNEIAREKEKSSGVYVSLPKRLRLKRIAHISGNLLFAAILVMLVLSLVSVYIAKSRGEVPKIWGGYSLFVVESGSMEPTLTVDSVIITKEPKDVGGLETGDIVTFYTGTGYVVTHRIIEIVEDENNSVLYRTKGDNPVNSPDEELLEPERVIGVYLLKIPFT